jgi:hypothetical protein
MAHADTPARRCIGQRMQVLHAIDIANVTDPTVVDAYPLPAAATDVETCGDVAAVAFENPDSKVLPGFVRVFVIEAGGARSSRCGYRWHC